NKGIVAKLTAAVKLDSLRTINPSEMDKAPIASPSSTAIKMSWTMPNSPPLKLAPSIAATPIISAA
ncbi:hypothetical protein, partial [Virgibacillus sp. 7505]|uniref:hypothetical protein n=1 Tax=Virgibacillus sp. 7505 TaxID=2022548 RepID=UPI001595A2CB